MKDYKLNFFCWLFGHKIQNFTDSGYNLCKRCNAHQYYDVELTNKWHNCGHFTRPFFKAKVWYNILKLDFYIWYNKKILKNENHLPF